MKQLKQWQGEFGIAYTQRNNYDWQQRLPAFQRILNGLAIERVLEVGCNRGHNLITLTEILGEGASVIGIEPNRDAQRLARSSSSRIAVLDGDAFDIPFREGWFDLVFTAGVLIHIALEDLPQALAEIYRVSRRYILALEYFAEEETVIPYHDHNDLLWKRNFLAHYLEQFPNLNEVRNGYLGPDEGFDRVHWWLLEK